MRRNRMFWEASPEPHAERDARPQEDVLDELSTNTMLEGARSTSTADSKAGNKVTAGPVPVAVVEAPVEFEYLKDLVPRLSSKLGVDLQVPQYLSAGCQLQCGYTSSRADEVVAPDQEVPPLSGAAPFRDHRLWIEWGAGATVLQAEIDVGEGNAVTIAGATARAMLVDWSWSRDIAQYTYPPLTSELAAAANDASQRGTVTTRVCAPYQVTLDPLSPPTIAEWQQALAQALAQRTYIR